MEMGAAARKSNELDFIVGCLLEWEMGFAVGRFSEQPVRI